MKGFEYKIKAIPTMFQGIQMRSRLEARWAAFFTECGWEWTYEPFDFDGWCPDFLLKLHRPIFVEVKPQITQALMAELLTVSQKLREDGARVLLVGDSIQYDGSDAVLGWGLGAGIFFDDCDACDEIVIGTCGGRSCPLGMSSRSGYYDCWVCNGYDGNPASDHQDVGIAEKWATACNLTQWNPPKAAAPSRRPKTQPFNPRHLVTEGAMRAAQAAAAQAAAAQAAAAQAAAAQAALRALPKKLLQKGAMRAAARAAARLRATASDCERVIGASTEPTEAPANVRGLSFQAAPWPLMASRGRDSSHGAEKGRATPKRLQLARPATPPSTRSSSRSCVWLDLVRPHWEATGPLGVRHNKRIMSVLRVMERAFQGSVLGQIP